MFACLRKSLKCYTSNYNHNFDVLSYIFCLKYFSWSPSIVIKQLKNNFALYNFDSSFINLVRSFNVIEFIDPDKN